MNKPLIVCALPQETQTKLNVWAGAKYELLYTGVGKVNATFEDLPMMIDFSHIKNPIGKNLTCYTGDSFATDLTPYDDVVDMEAYALAKTCRNLGKDFVSYKYISDDGNADDWEKLLMRFRNMQ